jgi:outer membrane protein OmpA-like peptidoglycan-associated protein
VGLAFRKLVSRARKTQQQKSNDAGASTRPPGKKLGAPVGVKVPAQTQPTNSTDSAQTAQGNGGEDLSTRLRQKQDSVIAQANAGNLKHEPLILEKATLYFNFEFNSTTLDEEARTYLDDLAKALADNPELNLRLVGHTDNVGSGKFNLRLSQQRAEALAEYLIDHGVLPQRIQVEGHGMREPLNNNENEEERSQNRRVELTITYDK